MSPRYIFMLEERESLFSIFHVHTSPTNGHSALQHVESSEADYVFENGRVRAFGQSAYCSEAQSKLRTTSRHRDCRLIVIGCARYRAQRIFLSGLRARELVASTVGRRGYMSP